LSPEKNLPFAFELLREFAQAHPDQAVVYDLIGSGSAAYEAKLHSLSAKLPSTIQVNFIGQLSPEALQIRLQPSGLSSQPSSLSSQVSSLIPPPSGLSYHALLMPSRTENFSYTVLESLQAGIPVLISDQTPWLDLQSQRVGWDLPLEDLSAWAAALEQLSHQALAERLEQSQRALGYAQEWGADYSQKAAMLFH
tara:strand:- start:253 stop:837 length:585 start_codon:yes stop_codon:yes gene_type:complete